MSPTDYKNQMERLRAEKFQAANANPLDWLNLAGLFWLEEGDNSFGSADDNQIVLSQLPAAHCGIFTLKNEAVTFTPAPGLEYSSALPNPTSRPLHTDLTETPDLINVGAIAIRPIVRGSAFLLRVWDREAPVKKEFKGFKYYPLDTAYIVKARYVRYDPPKEITRVDLIGTESAGYLDGQAHFNLHNQACTLEAEKVGDQLLFHFTDETSQTVTYGGGRKFLTSLPQGEALMLDFNLANNWPCAYTPYATCPMVLKENRLPIAIEAGEKKYFDAH
ncbi:MAG: DUF1684 domain-containing protein [Anaerolineales bacterium]|nr:DUF1684 domain-containing protein [Anaerolineales bacterium]